MAVEILKKVKVDHEYWAKEILKELIQYINNFKGGKKYITYGELAKRINYPEPHTGSAFAKNIGKTLGVMGHMFDNIFIDGFSIPLIQALVVNSGTKLPSDGLKEFNNTYPFLSKEKKVDFVNNEFDKIFKFANKWYKLLEKLDFPYEKNETSLKNNNLYNPFGSQGSPEHKELCEYIAENPSAIRLKTAAKGILEYPLKSGDKIDVVFETEDQIIGVEIKSKRSGDDDLERGIYQCIKYSSVLEAEKMINDKKYSTRCYLVIESSLPKHLNKIRNKLKVVVFDNITPKDVQ